MMWSSAYCFGVSSKAVVPVLVLLFVAFWFILQGDLLYVFPCVILFLCFSVLLVLRLPRLGNRELILVLFVRLFGLCLFGFVGFLFLLGSGKGCGLWLWHSLDFSLTFIILPGPLWLLSPFRDFREFIRGSLVSPKWWKLANLTPENMDTQWIYSMHSFLSRVIPFRRWLICERNANFIG